MSMSLSVQQIQKALEATGGLIAAAARRLGCSRQALYSRIQRNRRLQEFVEQLREEILDEAEAQLRRAVKRGETWAVTFLLRTLGRSRGYVERQETLSLTPQPAIKVDVSSIPTEVWEALERQRASGASAAGASAEAAPAVLLVDQA